MERSTEYRNTNQIIRGPRAATPRWIMQFAREHGLQVSTGHGRHGVRVVAETGGFRPLPVHRTLSTGVTRELCQWIIQNSTSL